MDKTVNHSDFAGRACEEVEARWIRNWPKNLNKEIARLQLVLGLKWEAVQSIPWDRCPDLPNRERFVKVNQIQVGHFLEMQEMLKETHLVLAHAQVSFWAGLSAQLKAVGALDPSLFGAHHLPKWLPFYFREGMDRAGLSGGLDDLAFDGILDAELLRYQEPHSAIFSMMQGKGDRTCEKEDVDEVELAGHFLARLVLRLLPACEGGAQESFISRYAGYFIGALSARATRPDYGVLWLVAIPLEGVSSLMGSSLTPLPGSDDRYQADAALLLSKGVTCFPLIPSPHSIAEGIVSVKKHLQSSIGMARQIMLLGGKEKATDPTSVEELDRCLLEEALRQSLETAKGKERESVVETEEDDFDAEELKRAIELSLKES